VEASYENHSPQQTETCEFTFAAGDIFDASVDAIVNSEQTNFVLSGNLVGNGEQR
jgi:hypothetical protein